MNKAMCA